MEWPNRRVAVFHDDPSVFNTRECHTRQCTEPHEHFVEVMGEHAVDMFECKHMSHVMVWHELTPTDHPLPVCPGGTVIVGKRWLPRRFRKTIVTKPCDTVTVRRVTG
jgi:hypothetical protein